MKQASKGIEDQPIPGVLIEGDKRFLSPRQLADRWDCSATTAQRITRNAGISKYCLGEGRNGMVRYPLSYVVALLDILTTLGGLVLYAVDSLLMARKRSWNYRAVSLPEFSPDACVCLGKRNTCELCGYH